LRPGFSGAAFEVGDTPRRSKTPYYLGFVDLEQKTLQPLDHRFGPRLSPMF
jgi:hypothetical protein